MSKPKTTETKPMSDTDKMAEEYRSKIERDEAIAAAKAEFLQKLANIGLTGNYVCYIVQNMHWELERVCKQHFVKLFCEKRSAIPHVRLAFHVV